jgi:hypothetical protein
VDGHAERGRSWCRAGSHGESGAIFPQTELGHDTAAVFTWAREVALGTRTFWRMTMRSVPIPRFTPRDPAQA